MPPSVIVEGRALPIFFCHADKRPTGLRGFNDATADPDRIEALRRGPLIAVPTGAVSEIDVVDFDVPCGTAWLAGTCPNLLDITRTHATPSGGVHLLFAHSPGLRCSAGRIARGVDVRSNGGYICWHPYSGCRVLSDAPVAPWPAWLIEAASRPTGPLVIEQRLHGPLLSAVTGTSFVPKALYLKVLRLVPVTSTVKPRDQRRVLGLLRMVVQREHHRNNGLNIAAFCMRELIGAGVVTREAAETLLLDAATLNGYVAKDGDRAALATIRSGLGPLISGPSLSQEGCGP